MALTDFSREEINPPFSKIRKLQEFINRQ